MNRRAVVVGLLAVAVAGPLIATAVGWDWYVEGPLIVGVAVAAGYAAGAWLRPVSTAVGVLLTAAGLLLAEQWHGSAYPWPDDLVFYLVVVGGPAGAGAAVRIRARQVRHLERLTGELAEQRRTEEAAARLDEQNRIQRQVHARLAERVAGIAVRAEGAQRSPNDDALAAIEGEARGVLDQLRAALGTLGPEAERAPATTALAQAPPPTSPADVVLAGCLGVALAVETTVTSDSRGPLWANVLGAMLVAAPLLVRRTRPVLAVAASCTAGVAMTAWLTPIPATVTGVAYLTLVFYTVGAWCRGWSWISGWLVAAAGVIAMEEVAGSAGGEGGVRVVLLWAVGAFVVGRITAGWHARQQRTERLVATIEDGRGAAVRLGRARERQAIASELHDTVAHSMTVVCLQAAAARRTQRDQDAALSTIATTARTSLAELREGLDAIDTSDDRLDPSRIGAIGRRVGVDLAVDSPPVAPNGPAAALAFRVIREAVVNVARHAPGASAEVRLTYADRELTLRVLDTGGTSSSPAVEGTGTGLSGLADAVSDAGGTLTWGPIPDGGFLVAATIPEAAT